MKTKVLLVFFISYYNISSAQFWAQWGNGTLSQSELFFVDTATNDLYAGNGLYLDALADSIFTIARWNGSNWNTLGNSNFFKNFWLTRIIKYQDTLYVSGRFLQSIYKLDGNDWISTNAYTSMGVDDIIEFNGKLWACGYFYSIGGVPAEYVAYYDSVWHSVPGAGWILGGRFHFVVFDGELYVYGNWGSSGSLKGIIKWNGSGWNSLGNGIDASGIVDPDHVIDDAIAYHGELYVAGDFKAGNGNPGAHIARWNGTQWNSVGLGANNYIHDLQIYHDELYVTGSFTEIGGVPCYNGIAKWNGSEWCSVDDSIGITMCVYNDDLIISGNFTSIHNQPIQYIAKWTGGNHVDTCSSPIGISEIYDLSGVDCYPNPAANAVTIRYPVSSYNFRIEVSDIFGKKIFEEITPINSSSAIIDISELASGIYVVKLFNINISYVSKILKE